MDGINGAYHQYETAIQTGQIIKDMSQITENMNAIMDTQYLACSELQIVNNELKDLNDTLNYIFDSIENVDNSLTKTSVSENIAAYIKVRQLSYSKLKDVLTAITEFSNC